MDKITPAGAVAPDGDPLEDLELRLGRLRSRMEAEGRRSAVRALDRAIARASRRRPLDKPAV